MDFATIRGAGGGGKQSEVSGKKFSQGSRPRSVELRTELLRLTSAAEAP